MRYLVLLIVVLVGCGPSARSGGDADGPCTDGQKICTGKTLRVCSNGAFVDQETCATACSPTYGCTLCEPGTGTCVGEVSTACKPDGSGYFEEVCDAVNGTTCDPQQGICVGTCGAHALGESYIGCNYFATQSSQIVSPTFDFGVSLSNTGSAMATVTIDGGELPQPIMVTVMPQQAVMQPLPWVTLLKRCYTQAMPFSCAGESAIAKQGAYRIRSNQPITVYQFSPIDYEIGGDLSFTNDASLLLPTNAWGGNYMVAGYQAWNYSGEQYPGLMAVTATHDATMVQITTTTPTQGGNGAPSFVPGVAQTVRLDRGDVLQLIAHTGDLTGSSVVADKPVEVLAGHHCTQLPQGSEACDHLEDQMFPTEKLATKYLVAANALPSSTEPRAFVVRVVATAPDTHVTFDPALPMGDVVLAKAGDMYEIPASPIDRLVTSNQKIVVAQYMVSQLFPPAAESGDPAMALAVPVAQYRRDYQFMAPLSYASNYVNVTATAGTTVTLDGAAIPDTAFRAIGTSGYSVARVPLSKTSATHRISAGSAFGISVYGYGSATSYWYPGGLDLDDNPVE